MAERVRVVYDTNNEELVKNRKELTKIRKELGATEKEIKDVEKGFKDTNKEIKKTSTGLTSMKGMIASIGLVALATAAAKAFLDLGLEIKKARKETALLTKETGTALDKIVAKIRATSKVFDKEYNEVLRAANTVSKEFGITMPAAIDAINEGFSKGIDINGEYLETLREYSTFAKAAGLDVGKFNAVIQAQLKEGVFSDKGIDAIKEAFLSIREMTQPTIDAIEAIGLSSQEMSSDIQSGAKTYFEVIQEIAKKTREEIDPRKIGMVFADIFKGAGEDANTFILSLDGIGDSMEELNEEQQKYVDLTDEALLNQEQFSLAAVSATDSLATAWLSVKKQAIPVLTAMLSLLADQEAKLEIDVIPIYKKWADLMELTPEPMKMLRAEQAKLKEEIAETGDALKEADILYEKTPSYTKESNELTDTRRRLNKSLEDQQIELIAINRLIEDGKKAEDDAKEEAEKAKLVAEAARKLEIEERKKINEELRRKLGLLQAEIALLVTPEIEGGILSALSPDPDRLKERVKENEQIIKDAGQKELERLAEIEDEKEQMQQAAFATGAALSNTLFSIKNNNLQREFLMAEGNAEKQKQISREMAENEKKQAAFNVIINTAAAIVKALPNPVLAAFAAAMGALQLGVILSQPLPKFKKGKIDIRGQKHEFGGIQAEIEDHESVMSAMATNKYKPALRKMNLLQLDPELVNALANNQMPVVNVNNSNDALLDKLGGMKNTNINIDESGFTVRQYGLFGSITRKNERFRL